MPVARRYREYDIGGPRCCACAAKNHRALRGRRSADSPKSRGRFAHRAIRPSSSATACRKVYAHAAYDRAIANHLARLSRRTARLTRPALHLHAPLSSPYGMARTLPGRSLYGTFNDYFANCMAKSFPITTSGPDAAAALIAEFAGGPPHCDPQNTPTRACGQAHTLREAWDKAYATDRQAPLRHHCR